MKERLDSQEDVIETYVPLAYIKHNKEKMDFAPCLINYIFVRATFEKLVKLKSNLELFEPLRFLMHPSYDEKYCRHEEVLTISDKMMDDYIRVTKEENEKVIILENMKYAAKPSREVQIIEGRFAGVIGRIKRIKSYRCVVLPIGNEMAIGVLDVPNSQLRYLTDEETKKLKGL
jgi:transcription antitermination factor NusG